MSLVSLFLPGLCSWWSLLVEICRTTDTLNGVGHSVYILFATICCHTGRVSRNVFFTDLARAAFTYPFPMDQLSPSYYQVAFTIHTKQIGRSRAIPSSKVHKPCIEGFLFLFKRPVHSWALPPYWGVLDVKKNLIISGIRHWKEISFAANVLKISCNS